MMNVMEDDREGVSFIFSYTKLKKNEYLDRMKMLINSQHVALEKYWYEMLTVS